MPDSISFRNRVIAIASELFPDVEFHAPVDEPDVLLAGKMQFGLQNIRAKFQLEEQSEQHLRALIETHFGQILHQPLALEELNLDEIRDQIFPQLMPAEYADGATSHLFSSPLASGISIGIVADFPQTYRYLTKEDLLRWNLSDQTLYEIAIANLNTASQGLDIQLYGSQTETFLAIASGDGYDAARILLPDLHDFISSHLGQTYRFGIPNRDFLICWRIDCSDSFHQNMRGQITQDHSERPYPLSSSVFVKNSEGNIHEQITP